MGNENSRQTRSTRNKVFRIEWKEEHDDWFKCYLDDYVEYENGNYKHIDFGKHTGRVTAEIILGDFLGVGDVPRTPVLNEGCYIRIDMECTKEHSSGHNFDPRSVRVVGRERTNESGETILTAAGGWADEVLATRTRYAEARRQAQWESQIVQRWTSLNIPPR